MKKKNFFSIAAASSLIFISGCCCNQNTEVSKIQDVVMNNKAPFKISNVSYSSSKYNKTVVVPFIDEEFKFGTGMTDPVWQKAAMADDFAPFRRKKLAKPSKFAVFRTRKHLVIGFFFSEDKGKIKYQPSMQSSPWSGDVAELHFGSMDPDPWLLQLTVGVSGVRFDSAGTFKSWKSAVFTGEEGWGAEVKLDLSLFKLSDGGMRFNISRLAAARNELSSWSPLKVRFHEVENFGELLFTDYREAFRLRYGIDVPGEMTRSEYEQAAARLNVPAVKVIHGPYVTAPGKKSISVAWATAGKVPSFVEYREKGSSDTPKRVFSGKQHGILEHKTEHFVTIDGLKPGTVYEYEIFVLTPVVLKPVSTKVKRSFKIPAEKELNFSFVASSDIHSNVEMLRNICSSKAGKNADFHIVIGDLLSHAAGPDALYEGIVDPMVEAEKKNPIDRPLLFVRGNHETLGVFASEYSRILPNHTSKTYYTFSYGDVFFVVLDTGNDKLDSPGDLLFYNRELLAEQKEFLKEVVKSEAYRSAKYRIVFQHIPPLSKKSVFFAQFHDLLAPLAESDLPPDAVICGHTHRYSRLDANAAQYSPASDKIWVRKNPHVTVVPYNLIINSSTTAMECKVSPESLNIRVFSAENGSDIDVFTIKPRK